MLSHILIVVDQLDCDTILWNVSYLLDSAPQGQYHLFTLFNSRIVFERFEEEEYLVSCLIFLAQGLSGQHLSLLLYKDLLIAEGDQAGCFPRKSASIQIDVKIQWEILFKVVLGNWSIGRRQQPYTFDGHNGKQLLEGCIWYVYL